MWELEGKEGEGTNNDCKATEASASKDRGITSTRYGKTGQIREYREVPPAQAKQTGKTPDVGKRNPA